MRQMNTKGWLAAVAMSILLSPATANAQESGIGEAQMTEQLSPVNVYIVSGGAIDANAEFSEIMRKWSEHYQVERYEVLVDDTGFKFPRNDCYLHADLVELSKQLNVAIEKLHCNYSGRLSTARPARAI